MNGIGRKEAIRSKPARVAIAAMLPQAAGLLVAKYLCNGNVKHGSKTWQSIVALACCPKIMTAIVWQRFCTLIGGQ